MDFQIKKEKNSNIILKISSTEEEFKVLEGKVINDINSKVSLPGFRKGKVANEVIKNKFASDIKEQILKDFANEAYAKYSEENKHELIENPQLLEAEIKDNKILIEISLSIFPEIKLPKYKGLKMKKKEATANQEEIEEALKYIANKNSKTKVVDKDVAAKDGDIVTIDYKGFIDGEAFEGGSQQDYDLRLGSNTFLKGFEKQIEGHKKGEEFDVKVKFPKNYFEKGFSNKAATFKVNLKEIKTVTVPFIDDELAKMENFENLEMLKKDLETKIVFTKQRDEDEKFFNEIIDTLKSKISIEIPENLIEKEVENKMEKLNEDINKKGISLKDHYKQQGVTEKDFKVNLRLEAENELKEMMIIRAIVKEENINVTSQEVDNYLKELFGNRLDKKSENYLHFSSQVESGLKLNKVKKFLIENNS